MRYVIQMKLFKEETKSKEWADMGHSPGWCGITKKIRPYTPYSYPSEQYAKEQMYLKRRANRIEGRTTEYRLRPSKSDEVTNHLGDRQVKEQRERIPSFWRVN